MLRPLAVVLALLAIPAAARADVPLPEDDPFFAVPPGLTSKANGTVLATRRVDVSAVGVPLPVTAWQVKYKTLTTQDRPTATVATVMVPMTPSVGPRPLVSYQTAEDGVGTKCAPSYALRAGPRAMSNSSPETGSMAYILNQGFAVVAPDYEGINSAFLGAKGEGHMVLDGIRAARRFKDAGLGASPVGMVGYSGGAFATSIAAQIQPRYAKGLKLAGVALGGVPADIKATFHAFNDSPASGAIFVGLIGIDRAYPKARLRDYLNDKGRAAYAASQKDCINDAVVRHGAQKADAFTREPGVVDKPRVTKLLARLSPLGVKGTPTAPVYGYHAIADEFAPIGPARKLYDRYCAAGVPVQRVEEPLGEHLSYAVTGLPGAVAYLGDRFAGKPAPNGC